MNPPMTPPTDNLYKFCAIAGTMLTVLFYFYPIYALSKGTDNIADIQRYEDIKNAEIMKTYGEADDMIRALDSADYSKLSPSQSAEFNALFAQAKELHLQNKEEAETANAEIKYRVRLQEEQDKLITTYLPHIRLGFYFSWLVGLYGYFGWYFHVQRYQDYLLRKEAEAKHFKETHVAPFAFLQLFNRWPRMKSIVTFVTVCSLAMLFFFGVLGFLLNVFQAVRLLFL